MILLVSILSHYLLYISSSHYMGINSTIKIYFENIVTLAYLFKIININILSQKKLMVQFIILFTKNSSF